MSKRQFSESMIETFVKGIEKKETQSGSSGWVDKDWDKIDEVEQEYVERIRNRGVF